ncbi:MAG: transporter substrate-binding domain-containing protein [Sneathiella sp.]|nr:transporter substrate-binding domain-containing protein [Sneathiella sp.]
MSKRFKLSSLSLLAGTITLIGLSSQSFAATELTFCTEDKDQPPYVIGDAGILDQNPGVAVEMVNMAAKRIGVSVKFKRAPWKRCLAILEKGEVDGVFMGSYKKARMKFGAYPMAGGNVDPSRRLTESSYSLYRLKGSAPNWDGKAFSGIDGKVGAPLGYSIVKDLEKKGLKMEESKGTPTDFKKMTLKRIVAAAALTNVGDALLESGDFPNVEKVETPLVTKPYYVLLSNQLVKANKDLAEKFWKEIGNIRENEAKTMAKKYR